MAPPGSGFSIILGFVVMLLGPFSMFLHSGFKDWTGWFDAMSIVLWLSYCIAYSLSRQSHNQGWAWAILLLIWVPIVVGIGIAEWVDPGTRIFGTVITAAVFIILEGIISNVSTFSRNHDQSIGGVQRSAIWYWASIGTFAVAILGFWLFSGGTGSVNDTMIALCPPGDSWFQPHAMWHILSAVTAVLVYYYFASETLKGRSS